MYKSIHDIPTYNFYQCHFGNYSYMGRGRKKKQAFENIKRELGQVVESNQILIDLSVRRNMVTEYSIVIDAIRKCYFANKEQKERLLEIAKPLGLSLDYEKNVDLLKRLIEGIERDEELISVEASGETKQMAEVYRMAAVISKHSQGRDIDIKKMPIAEFTELCKMVRSGTKH